MLCKASELEKVGVDLVGPVTRHVCDCGEDFTGPTLKCVECEAVWSPPLDDDGTLDQYAWECPEGCNFRPPWAPPPDVGNCIEFMFVWGRDSEPDGPGEALLAHLESRLPVVLASARKLVNAGWTMYSEPDSLIFTPPAADPLAAERDKERFERRAKLRLYVLGVYPEDVWCKVKTV